MATIESYDKTSNGSTKYTGSLNKTVSAVALREKLVRTGTGSRRKPSVPDQTGYSREQLRIVSPRGSGEYHNTALAVQWEGVVPSFGNYPKVWKGGDTSFDSNLLDQANLKALSSFNRMDLDLGTAWKEREKTVELVRDVATIGVKAMQAIKQRNGRKLLDVLGLNHHGARGRGVVDSYLTYHYGMKPLLQDVAGVVQVLTRLPSGMWRVQAKGTHSASGSGKYAEEVYSYPWFGESTYRENAKAVLSATPRPLTREEDRLWALGLDNPLNTAWETTPFSFVVDWLVPVGDWLQALNSIKYYTGWVSVLTQFRKDVATYTGWQATNGSTSGSSSLSGEGTSVRMLRRISGIPLAGLPIKDPRSLGHMAKALSLMASMAAHKGDLPPTVRY